MSQPPIFGSRPRGGFPRSNHSTMRAVTTTQTPPPPPALPILDVLARANRSAALADLEEAERLRVKTSALRSSVAAEYRRDVEAHLVTSQENMQKIDRDLEVKREKLSAAQAAHNSMLETKIPDPTPPDNLGPPPQAGGAPVTRRTLPPKRAQPSQPGYLSETAASKIRKSVQRPAGPN